MAGDRGAVTVEAALGICSLVLVFALGVGGLCAVIGQLRCTDAAVEAARLTARGSQAEAAGAVRRLAPTGATLTVSVTGDQVTAEVRSPLPGGFLPGKWLKSTALAVMEPGAATAAVEPAPAGDVPLAEQVPPVEQVPPEQVPPVGPTPGPSQSEGSNEPTTSRTPNESDTPTKESGSSTSGIATSDVKENDNDAGEIPATTGPLLGRPLSGGDLRPASSAAETASPEGGVP
ncbi:TadE family type IV pilus minor pilin [Saccharopolyspora erythraea]|uniref:TadE family type IV pilus minor pilin n=1 Tax=Saccharopolyspora erythraea TaxID=1836 RepID=UPI001E531E37|nr:TadE family type IV pilus minor pilin [Saccharopolyspora erythraea]